MLGFERAGVEVPDAATEEVSLEMEGRGDGAGEEAEVDEAALGLLESGRRTVLEVETLEEDDGVEGA